MPELSIVICTYNREVLLRKCLASILETTQRLDTEVIVVENGSIDGTVKMVVTEFPDVQLIKLPTSVGFCVANNIGVEAASGRYVMLLNNDAALRGDAAALLLDLLRRMPEVKCVGPRVLLANGDEQPRVFGNLPSLWRVGMQSLQLQRLFPRFTRLEGVDGRRPGPGGVVGWISGVCMAMRRDDYLAAKGFDESFYMYCEDVDLCRKLTLEGGVVMRAEGASVVHYGGGQAGSLVSALRNARLQQRNLLRIVQETSGPGRAKVAAALILMGLLPRLLVGVAALPRRGWTENTLLQTTWARLRDLTRSAPALDLPGVPQIQPPRNSMTAAARSRSF